MQAAVVGQGEDLDRLAGLRGAVRRVFERGGRVGWLTGHGDRQRCGDREGARHIRVASGMRA